MTLYGGILLLPLALVGLVTVDRRRLHFVVMAIVMLLFTLGTLISIAAFRVWPGMRFFRHIALVSPFVKVLLIFVAGIGFERLFGRGGTDRKWMMRAAAIAAAIVLIAGAWLALDLAQSPSTLLHYMDPDPVIDRPDHMYDPLLVARRLHASAALAVAGAAMIAAAAFTPNRLRAVMMAVAVSFVAVDVYYFKFNHLLTRSDVVPQPARAVLRPAPMTFPQRRDLELRAALLTSGRLRATLTFNHVLRQSLQGRAARGTQYLDEPRLPLHRRGRILVQDGLLASPSRSVDENVLGRTDRRCGRRCRRESISATWPSRSGALALERSQASRPTRSASSPPPTPSDRRPNWRR